MTGYTYERLHYDEKSYQKFFTEYDQLIQQCKRFGFLQTARDHAANKKRIAEELALLK